MYKNSINLAILLVAILTSSLLSNAQAESNHNRFDSILSPAFNDFSTQTILGVCIVNSVYAADTEPNESFQSAIDSSVPVSMNYINDEVKGAYNIMRDKVISHVKSEVVRSLLSFNANGFAPENIAAFVADATKPFLPFKFANGVNIIGVTHKNRTVVYRAEMPIYKNYNYAILLTKAGIASATTTVCNDSTMVEDLLERHVVIQYDYYDSNGVFIGSFNIKDGHTEHEAKLEHIS